MGSAGCFGWLVVVESSKKDEEAGGALTDDGRRPLRSRQVGDVRPPSLPFDSTGTFLRRRRALLRHPTTISGSSLVAGLFSCKGEFALAEGRAGKRARGSQA